MDVKTVMPGITIPNHIEKLVVETVAANTAIGGRDTAPLPSDSLIIGLIAMLKNLSAKTINAVNEQNTLLQMLPESVRYSAEHILQQSLPNLDTLGAGLASLLHSRRDAANSLTDLAQKLQWAAEIFQSTENPDEILIEIKQFHQQVKDVLEQITLKSSEMSQTDLQQVREQIHLTIPHLLRQAAGELSQTSSASNPSVPANILKAADVLNLPELPQLWLLAASDFENLSNGSLAGTKQQAVQTTGKEPAGTAPMGKEAVKEPGKEPPLALSSNAGQAKSASELFTDIKRFTQQLTKVLAQIDLNAKEIDLVILHQAREQMRSAISDLMRQAAENFALRPASSGSAAMPAAIRQAAVLLNLPELLQLGPLSDKELVALLTTTAPGRLAQSAATIRTLSELVNRAFIVNSEDQGQAAIFTMQMPFLAESAQLEPVHIHIYHEKGKTKQDGSKTKPDTWVRLTLEPEHTGAITAIFHLREAATLDIKVIFADKKASLLFADSVSSIRKACSDFSFLLGDVSII